MLLSFYRSSLFLCSVLDWSNVSSEISLIFAGITNTNMPNKRAKSEWCGIYYESFTTTRMAHEQAQFVWHWTNGIFLWSEGEGSCEVMLLHMASLKSFRWQDKISGSNNNKIELNAVCMGSALSRANDIFTSKSDQISFCRRETGFLSCQTVQNTEAPFPRHNNKSTSRTYGTPPHRHGIGGCMSFLERYRSNK